MVRAVRRWALWVGVCLFALVAWVPRAAWAQTATCPNVAINVVEPVNRYHPGPDVSANEYPLRADNLDPTAINFADCNANIHLQFNLSVGGLPCTDIMQVWIGNGVDCTQVASREAGSVSGRCWQVLGDKALSETLTVDIRAQDLVAFISNLSPPATYTPQGATACQSQTAPGTLALTMYFMAMDPGLTVDGTPAMYTFNAALLGPYPPTGVTAGVGENLIVVNWTPATDSTIQGFNVYCENQGGRTGDGAVGDGTTPPPTLVCADTGAPAVTDGATDGSTASTDVDACVLVNVGGTSGAGGSSCVSTNLVDSFCLVNGASVPVDQCASSTTPVTIDAGEAGIITTPVLTDAESAETSVPTGTATGISNISDVFLCGQVGGNTTNQATIQSFADGGPSIQDGTKYAVGVAAFDGEGNTGLISALSCVTPAPVVTFWDQYLLDGGLAGGGFCALEGAGIPVSGSLFGIGMTAAALTYVRRRRRSR